MGRRVGKYARNSLRQNQSFFLQNTTHFCNEFLSSEKLLQCFSIEWCKPNLEQSPLTQHHSFCRNLPTLLLSELTLSTFSPIIFELLSRQHPFPPLPQHSWNRQEGMDEGLRFFIMQFLFV